MSALNFDPYAVLAEIELQNLAPAKPAIVAKVPTEDPQALAGLATLAGVRPQISKSAEPAHLSAQPTDDDPEIYLAHLHEHGATTYGAMARALEWGATRAWQTEAKLRTSGRIVMNSMGRGAPKIPPAPPENSGAIQDG